MNRAIASNGWTLLIPAAALFARGWVGRLLLPLGIVGGLLVMVATAAFLSSYLYFLGELVHGRRVSARELKTSFGAHFWPLVNLYFVAWIASLVFQLWLGGKPGSPGVLLAPWIIAFVVFNTVPEVIYLRGTDGALQTIAASWEFLKAQWLAWLVPIIPLVAVSALAATRFRLPFVGEVLVGAVLHVVMVFRGALFRALDGKSHRQRMFAERVA
jgi:hypothetical protein